MLSVSEEIERSKGKRTGSRKRKQIGSKDSMSQEVLLILLVEAEKSLEVEESQTGISEMSDKRSLLVDLEELKNLPVVLVVRKNRREVKNIVINKRVIDNE